MTDSFSLHDSVQKKSPIFYAGSMEEADTLMINAEREKSKPFCQKMG